MLKVKVFIFIKMVLEFIKKDENVFSFFYIIHIFCTTSDLIYKSYPICLIVCVFLL